MLLKSKFWSPHRSRTRWASLCHSLDVEKPIAIKTVLTVVPLTSVKEHTNLEKLGKDRNFHRQ